MYNNKQKNKSKTTMFNLLILCLGWPPFYWPIPVAKDKENVFLTSIDLESHFLRHLCFSMWIIKFTLLITPILCSLVYHNIAIYCLCVYFHPQTLIFFLRWKACHTSVVLILRASPALSYSSENTHWIRPPSLTRIHLLEWEIRLEEVEDIVNLFLSPVMWKFNFWAL